MQKNLKTSTEWVIEYLLKSQQYHEDFPDIAKLVTIEAVTPITNAWTERSASTVNRMKSRLKITMKSNKFNTLSTISLNSPPVNSNQCDQVIQRVVEEYIKQRHIKLPQPVRVPASKYSCTSSTQTLNTPIDTIGKGKSEKSNVLGRINAEVNMNYIQTYSVDES